MEINKLETLLATSLWSPKDHLILLVLVFDVLPEFLKRKEDETLLITTNYGIEISSFGIR